MPLLIAWPNSRASLCSGSILRTWSSAI